eukprot:PITA_15194
MAFVGECVEIEPYSFEEAVQQLIWVYAMVEEYDSVVWNSVWDVVPRPENKLVVSSHWLYKVKQATDDLCYAVNHLSQAMVQPTKLFWKATKHVLRYLRGTSYYGLWYRQIEGVKLQGFTDADWAGSPSDRKRTSGGIFILGSTTVSWYRRKQRSVALSLAEAEYMVASQATCEAIWMQKILVGLFDQRMDPTMIYCDN